MPATHNSDLTVVKHRPPIISGVLDIHCRGWLAYRPSSDQHQDTFVAKSLVSERRLKHSGMFCINITERVLGICDLIYHQPNLQPLEILGIEWPNNTCARALAFNETIESSIFRQSGSEDCWEEWPANEMRPKLHSPRSTFHPYRHP